MESAQRYLKTIETLMIENSRLAKDLEDALNGKMPSFAMSRDTVEQCLSSIDYILGPVAGENNLLQRIHILCNEYVGIANEQQKINTLLKKHIKEKEAIEQAARGDDVEDETTPTVKSVVRLRGILEVIKTRLDRLVACGDSSLLDLRKDVECFLAGKET